MRIVNEARLSAYLREVARGETYLVTDRDAVVARLGPPPADERGAALPDEILVRLVSLGARPPLRPRRPGDLRRTGQGAGLTTSQIDALLDEARDETH